MRRVVNLIVLVALAWCAVELYTTTSNLTCTPITEPSYDILTTHTDMATMAETLQLPLAQVVRVNEKSSQNPIFKNQTLAKAHFAKLRSKQKEYSYLFISTSDVVVAHHYVYALRRLIC